MRLAWFAPQPNDAALELGRVGVVDHFDARRAHDFVWQHFRTPYDLTVFELDDTARHAFVWPYLFHYPGVVLLHANALQHSRNTMLTLARRHQHLRTERAFSGWNFMRAPLTASRLVVVHDAALAREVQEIFPDLQVRIVPPGAAPASVRSSDGPPRFHVVGSRHDGVNRAAARARDGGVHAVVADASEELQQDDVVIALEWPPSGSPLPGALRAMAAGLPVIVFETEAAATWPTLDAQTWQQRGYLGNDPPIAISIDPRDEEHSLMLAMRRLAVDTALRTSLGAAAATWARDHASVERAADAWRAVLAEATTHQPLVIPAELPRHLTADGSDRPRALLNEVGASVDFLNP
jgi:hypothetical protein